MFELSGADELREIFTFPLAFHDAEVLSITLDRKIPSATYALLVPKYENNEYVATFEVVLQFSGIENFHLEAFNHQNVINSIVFKEMFERTEYSSKIERRIHVDHQTVFGAWSTFTCSDVQLVSVNRSWRKVGDINNSHQGT